MRHRRLFYELRTKTIMKTWTTKDGRELVIAEYVFDTVKELFGYLRRGQPSGLFFEHESDLETYIKTKYALRAFKTKSQ